MQVMLLRSLLILKENLEYLQCPGITRELTCVIENVNLKKSSNLPLSQINVKWPKLSPCIKKVLQTDPKNFRPILLLPLISQIIKWIIHHQTMNFLSDSNVLYKYQSGFKKLHSTDTCLSYLHDKITKSFDSGLLTRMVSLDLQKAIDTID